MHEIIRVAKPEDSEAIREIYAPYTEKTAISFEQEPPSPEEMCRRVSEGLQKYPWLVAEIDGVVVGYAYAGTHRARHAYSWSCEVSAYIHEDHHGKKLGSRLYTELFKIIEELGYANAYAGITVPNEASIGMHKRMGFSSIGTFSKVGFKFGKWWDVSWWQKPLNCPEIPQLPIPFSERGVL